MWTGDPVSYLQPRASMTCSSWVAADSRDGGAATRADGGGPLSSGPAVAPEGFIAMRRRWDVFQLIRGSLQLVGFVVLAVGLVGV